MGVSRADNSTKTWRNLPFSNLKPDLHNINAHNQVRWKFMKFTRYHQKMKSGRASGR